MNVKKPSKTFMVLPGVRDKAYTSDHARPMQRRPTAFGWLPNRIRNHFIAMIGEFFGTFLFLFFAFSATQVANEGAASAMTPNPGAPNTSTLLYISLAFGFSLAVNVWVFFRISGGLFNPAVTLGLCLIGAVGWSRGMLVGIAQVLGAIVSAAVVSSLFPGPLSVRTTLESNTSVVRGFFIEAILTAELVFTIFMLAAEKHKGTFLAPVGIGLALFIAELSGVFFTGGSLNPARSFAPDVVLGHFNGYHWIYWAGPFAGSVFAVLFYRLVKFLEYETANPGQDFNDKDAQESKTRATPTPAKAAPHPTEAKHAIRGGAADQGEFKGHPGAVYQDRSQAWRDRDNALRTSGDHTTTGHDGSNDEHGNNNIRQSARSVNASYPSTLQPSGRSYHDSTLGSLPQSIPSPPPQPHEPLQPNFRGDHDRLSHEQAFNSSPAAENGAAGIGTMYP